MDVLRPPLVWIDGRCYRKPAVERNSANATKYNEEDVTYEVQQDKEEDNSQNSEYITLEEISGGRFRTEIHAPSTFFALIIGTKGATKKRIESETKTQINVPPFGKTGEVVITGCDRAGVCSARSRIEMLVQNARRRTQFTHFISLPLTVALKDCFMEFKAAVLKDCKGSRGLDDTLFQNPDKLHLTLGTLVLLDTYERKKAAEILEQCQKEIVEPLLQNQPLIVTVKGLEYMNDDPAEVDVLYANIKPKNNSFNLQEFSDRIVEKFVNSDIMTKQYNNVKLHATIINTLFRQTGSAATDSQTGPADKSRESFDARDIFNKFGSYSFGECRIPSIQISERYSTAKDTGYYSCTAKLDLPTIKGKP